MLVEINIFFTKDQQPIGNIQDCSLFWFKLMKSTLRFHPIGNLRHVNLSSCLYISRRNPEGNKISRSITRNQCLRNIKVSDLTRHVYTKLLTTRKIKTKHLPMLDIHWDSWNRMKGSRDSWVTF